MVVGGHDRAVDIVAATVSYGDEAVVRDGPWEANREVEDARVEAIARCENEGGPAVENVYAHAMDNHG